MIVTDVLADVFGYDKYSEVTRELCIRGTFCDLATRIDGKFQMLIEVKAIGLELKDGHARQAGRPGDRSHRFSDHHRSAVKITGPAVKITGRQ